MIENGDGYSEMFLAPKVGTGNMDRFLVRAAILKTVNSHREKIGGVMLDVGCGQAPYKKLLMSGDPKITSYIGLDQEENPIHNNRPDLVWNSGRIPLDDSVVDTALCTEVLEHCPRPKKVLMEIQRVLKPAGYLILTTPFLWPLHEAPFDEYRYTPFAMERLLREAGFDGIDIRPLGGWDASMAQMIGLWARRRNVNRWSRAAWCVGLYPIYRLLLWSDRHSARIFEKAEMFTGLSAVARKPVPGFSKQCP